MIATHDGHPLGALSPERKTPAPGTDHTAFRVTDLDASIAFYTQALGLRLLFRSVNEEEGEAYAFLELRGGNLELIQTLREGYVPGPIVAPYCPHLALETDDLPALLLEIKAKGIHLVRGPLEIPGHERWLYLSDPDNNVIEYIQWIVRPETA